MPKVALKYQPIIKASIAAVVEGEGSLEERLQRVVAELAKIPSANTRATLAKALKPKLTAALRSRAAKITSATTLPTTVAEALDATARQKGALLVEQRIDEKLLAGFQFELGDDRWDESLKTRLNKFI
jgi:F0F1-type ATP synthase delta subunit